MVLALGNHGDVRRLHAGAMCTQDAEFNQEYELLTITDSPTALPTPARHPLQPSKLLDGFNRHTV